MTSNPREHRSRVRNFDHTDIGDLPEYHAVQMALDALAHALERLDRHGSRQEWLDLVADMASVLTYSDACPEQRGHLDDAEAGIVPPFKVDRDGDWIKGTYYCPLHERVWTCGYALSLLEYV